MCKFLGVMCVRAVVCVPWMHHNEGSWKGVSKSHVRNFWKWGHYWRAFEAVRAVPLLRILAFPEAVLCQNWKLSSQGGDRFGHFLQ